MAHDAERGRYLSGSEDKTLKIWDAEGLKRWGDILLLPEQQWASIKPGKDYPAAMSEGAGEYLMWVGHDPADGKLRAYPYEARKKE